MPNDGALNFEAAVIERDFFNHGEELILQNFFR
jgi:hypothetical protein